MGFCNCSMFCCALLCVYSSITISSMGKRDFLTMLWVCLQFVIVVFPDHTHYFRVHGVIPIPDALRHMIKFVIYILRITGSNLTTAFSFCSRR